MLDVGIGIGLQFLGIRARHAFVCEWEAGAANTLRVRMEDQAMEPCPIWCGDLAEFDGIPWRGAVDIFVAGLPCQPYSCAGKGRGESDERSYGEEDSGPVPQFIRICEETQPAMVFLENVPVWVSCGHFARFGRELSALGYAIEEPIFLRASDVGANHKRERVFVLAHQKCEFIREQRRIGGASWSHSTEPGNTGEKLADTGLQHINAEQRAQRVSKHPGSGCDVDDTTGPRYARGCLGTVDKETQRSGARMSGSDERCGELGDAISERLQEWAGERRDFQPEFSTAQRAMFAPGPGEHWGGVDEFLHPAVEPGFRQLVNGVAMVVDEGRASQLRQAGNGVVPLQAAVAFVLLARELFGNT